MDLPVVIDFGSSTVYAGFPGGEFVPRAMFPTIVGRPREHEVRIS
jgi:actin-related protein